MRQVAQKKIFQLFNIAFGVLILLVFGGVITRAATIYRINPGQTITVDEQGICKQVTNTSASGKSYFIPTNTLNEWNLFLQNKPSDVSLQDCSAPASSCGNNDYFCIAIKNTQSIASGVGGLAGAVTGVVVGAVAIPAAAVATVGNIVLNAVQSVYHSVSSCFGWC